ncbi:MAG: hypothetical protein AB1742_02070 [bacterium]
MKEVRILLVFFVSAVLYGAAFSESGGKAGAAAVQPLAVVAAFHGNAAGEAAPVAVAQKVQAAEESAVGGNILNPLPGEEIVDRQPMIGIKLPTLDPPISHGSIRLFFDGNDVTGETQVSIEYIFYTPPVPLAIGVHNVRVTYSDIEGTAQPTLEWFFSVVAKPRVAAPPVKVPLEPVVSTSGKLTLKAGNVFFNNAARGTSYPSTDIKYKESPIFTQIFDFTHKAYGKTLTGHFDRSIE